MAELKDSGARKQFSTGAVRDIHEGKGRMDLIPGAAMVMLMQEWGHPMSAAAAIALAKHFEDGAKKYADRNWEKGMDTHAFVDSGMRHLYKAYAKMKDEPHLRAFVWNIVCYIDTDLAITSQVLPQELATFNPRLQPNPSFNSTMAGSDIGEAILFMHKFMATKNFPYLAAAVSAACSAMENDEAAADLSRLMPGFPGALEQVAAAAEKFKAETGPSPTGSGFSNILSSVAGTMTIKPGNIVSISSGIYLNKYHGVSWRVLEVDAAGMCRVMSLEDGGCADISMGSLFVEDASDNELKPIHRIYHGCPVYVKADKSDRWAVEGVDCTGRVLIKCVTDKTKGIKYFDFDELDFDAFDQSRALDQHLQKVKNKTERGPEIKFPGVGDIVMVKKHPKLGRCKVCAVFEDSVSVQVMSQKTRGTYTFHPLLLKTKGVVRKKKK